MLYIKEFVIDFLEILNEMSPYLMLGFLFAGLLKVLFPQSVIDKHLGKRNLKSVLYSTLIGIPLPLCSCGVIPTGVSFYKNGASKGASVSFLISTPQTGVDSILVTYSLLGLPFAILRPIIALFTGILGGFFVNIADKADAKLQPTITTIDDCNTDCGSSCGCGESCKSETSETSDTDCGSSCDCGEDNSDKAKKTNKIQQMFKYAFVDFLQDISKWLIIGLLLAALISVLIPDNFFSQFIGNSFIEMLVILLASIPLYVCATGSVPIAAVLLLKGISPGAALVFLMAGPATNAATITVLGKALGKKTMWIYLISIITGSLLFGLLINNFLPAEWFSILPTSEEAINHSGHDLLPAWLKITSSIILTLLIINGFIQKKIRKNKTLKAKTMDEKIIIVNGMTCNHCKNSVEKNISAMRNIDTAEVNLEQKKLKVSGKNINIKKIKKEIEKLGFEFGGEA